MRAALSFTEITIMYAIYDGQSCQGHVVARGGVMRAQARAILAPLIVIGPSG
jgi:hypothetical protein